MEWTNTRQRQIIEAALHHYANLVTSQPDVGQHDASDHSISGEAYTALEVRELLEKVYNANDRFLPPEYR